MKKIRIGNDIVIKWRITIGGEEVNLEGLDLSLYISTTYQPRKQIAFTVAGNEITATFKGVEQKVTGVYRLTLYRNEGENAQSILDACDAFELVSCSCLTVDAAFGGAEVELPIADLGVGIPGLSAYEIAVAEGYEGTQEEWLASLSAASEAAAAECRKFTEAAKISEKERQNNEALRVTAENERVANERTRALEEQKRVNAESLRVSDEVIRKTAEEARKADEQQRSAAEVSRSSAEELRKSNEQSRISEETTRSNNEAARAAAETKRANAEAQRETAEADRRAAEQLRIANETARQTAEQDRMTAEANRKTAESARKTAEDARIANGATRQTNEQARVSAETSRESAETDRADAEVARAEAEQARAEEFAGFTATLAAKEDADNKVTSIKADADDVHYPSAKAVKDSLAKVKNIEVTPDMLSESTKQFINASGGGTITNFADDEDLKSVDNALKLADKAYDPITYSGMGRKYLRKNFVDGKNILTQEMLPSANTIYIIQYDYDLNGATITIPANCTLDFQGGSLANGTIIGTQDNLNAPIYQIFNNVDLAGIWVVNEVYPEWFGAKGDGITDDTAYIQQAINTCQKTKRGGKVILLAKDYVITETIYIKNYVSLTGVTCTPRLKGSRLICKFINSKSWAIESALYKDGQQYKHSYKDIIFSQLESGFLNGERCWSISVSNLAIINGSKSPLYGCMRLYGTLYSSIQNIFAVGFHFGITVTATWQFKLDSCYIRTINNAFAFGHEVTVLNCYNCYGGYYNYDIDGEPYQREVTNEDLPTFVDPDNIYPRWLLEKETFNKWDLYACFICECSYVSFYTTTCDSGDILILSYQSKSFFHYTHLENLTSIAWAYDKKDSSISDTGVDFYGSSGYNRRKLSDGSWDLESYVYGAVNSVISCNQFFTGRCYVNNDLYTTKVPELYRFTDCRYVIPSIYYNRWDIGDDGMPSNVIKDSKIKFVDQNIIFATKKKTKESILSLGINGNDEAYFGTIIEDDERLNGSTIILKTYSVWDRQKPLTQKTVSLSGYLGTSVLILECPIYLDQSTIDFTSQYAGSDIIMQKREADLNTPAFRLKNSNSIFLKSKQFITLINRNNPVTHFKPLAEIIGDTVCNIYTGLEPQTLLYIQRGDAIISNPNNCRYTINCIDVKTNTIFWTFTNANGTSTQRPTLSSTNEGFEYYDSTLKKKILWNGTEWTNLDGTSLE